MGIPYKRTKRIENKFVEKTFNPFSDFYAVGSDSKGKNYILRMEHTTNVLARKEAREWAREEKLTLDYIGGFKN